MKAYKFESANADFPIVEELNRILLARCSASDVGEVIAAGLDHSAGGCFAAAWNEENLGAFYAERKRRWLEIPGGPRRLVWHYPGGASDIFEDWFLRVYVGVHLCKFLQRKMDAGKISPGTLLRITEGLARRYRMRSEALCTTVKI